MERVVFEFFYFVVVIDIFNVIAGAAEDKED